jgi:hypothetical protein
MQTQFELAMNGIQLYTHVFNAGSLLVAERNAILKIFHESDATHLLMIDADIGWNAKDVIRFIEHDKDFIAGVYPSRTEANRYPWVPKVNNDEIETKDGLFKAIAVPAGFVMIKKNAINKIVDYHKDKAYNAPNGVSYLLFDTEVNDGYLWGEDFVFTKRVLESGIEVFVDPYIQLSHNGINGTLINNIKEK